MVLETCHRHVAYLLSAIVQIVMEALMELQIQIFAFVFGGLRLASRIPKLIGSKRIDKPSRESPPECLFDPLLGCHMFVKIKGTKYHYVENGSRRQEMILCLHDFGDFWYGWRSQLRALGHSNWVVALDLKGSGDSEKPFIASKYKDEVIVEELKQFIDVLQENDKKIVLLGHGLGGHIAWKFVETYPSMVRKFISISAPHPRIWLKHVIRSWRSVIENRWLYVCRLPFLPEMEMVENDVEIFDKRFKNSSSVMDLNNYSNFDKEAYKYTFSRTTDWQGPINYLRNLPLADSNIFKREEPNHCIPVETLLLVGNNDPEVSLDLMSQSAEYVNRFASQIVNGAGHNPHQEQPDFVNKLIAKFVEGPDSDIKAPKKNDNAPQIFKTQKSTGNLINSSTTPSKTAHQRREEGNKDHNNDKHNINQKAAEEPNNNINKIACSTEENAAISYKTPVSKVMEYGTNMINSYKAPVDKALESSSNMLSSGITSITNKVTKIPVIEQYVPWLSEDDQ